jgi:CubicO group peptidase (beta-lactamase class C family)
MTTPDLSPVLDLLEAERDRGLHDGAQVYVSYRGETLLRTAIGESRPGRALEPDDLMLWYSASKPVTAVAILQLWEQERLGLDDPIAKFVDGWAGGKESCTVRHVLTHTGGFPMYREAVGEMDVEYADKVALIAAHPAEWVPGTQAGYHLTTGWTILGAVVEAVDGRPIADYVAEEIFAPAGMPKCRMGVPADEYAALGDRLAPVRWKGHVMPARREDGSVDLVPYDIEKRGHNEAWYRGRVEPGSSIQGPAAELGHFYESLLGFGPRILGARTVEVLIATHRSGMRDRLFGNMKVPWGLGVNVSGGLTGGVGRRAFGHGGMASSRGMADPDAGLVLVFVTNGLPAPVDNEQRLYEITDAVYTALGDEVAHLRRSSRPPTEAVYSS